MYKKVMFCIIMLSSFLPIYSQEEKANSDDSSFMSAVADLMPWIKNIDKELNEIENKENLYTLNRNLGYVSLYLDQIMTQKVLLAIQLNKLKSENKNELLKQQINYRVDRIISDINELERYLSDIKSLLSQTNKSSIDQIIKKVENDLYERKMKKLDIIKESISEKQVSPEDLVKKARSAKEITEGTIAQIKIAQDKILVLINK